MTLYVIIIGLGQWGLKGNEMDDRMSDAFWQAEQAAALARFKAESRCIFERLEAKAAAAAAETDDEAGQRPERSED